MIWWRKLFNREALYLRPTQGKFHWTSFITNLQEPKFIWFDPLNFQDRAVEFLELRSLRDWLGHEVALHKSIKLPNSFKIVIE